MSSDSTDTVMTDHLDAYLQFLKQDENKIDCKRNGRRTTTNEEEVLVLNVRINNQTGESFKNINA
jgi:hypothetical protein